MIRWRSRDHHAVAKGEATDSEWQMFAISATFAHANRAAIGGYLTDELGLGIIFLCQSGAGRVMTAMLW